MRRPGYGGCEGTATDNDLFEIYAVQQRTAAGEFPSNRLVHIPTIFFFSLYPFPHYFRKNSFPPSPSLGIRSIEGSSENMPFHLCPWFRAHDYSGPGRYTQRRALVREQRIEHVSVKFSRQLKNPKLKE